MSRSQRHIALLRMTLVGNQCAIMYWTSTEDALLGVEECQSPFGIYEVKIPVNKNLECDGIGITGNNCKDIDVSVYSEILFYEQWEPERTYFSREIGKIWEEMGSKRKKRGREGKKRGIEENSYWNELSYGGFFPNRTTQKKVRIARREAWRKVQRNSVQNWKVSALVALTRQLLTIKLQLQLQLALPKRKRNEHWRVITCQTTTKLSFGIVLSILRNDVQQYHAILH